MLIKFYFRLNCKTSMETTLLLHNIQYYFVNLLYFTLSNAMYYTTDSEIQHTIPHHASNTARHTISHYNHHTTTDHTTTCQTQQGTPSPTTSHRLFREQDGARVVIRTRKSTCARESYGCLN